MPNLADLYHSAPYPPPVRPSEVTMYASPGFDGATMLFADIERLRWRMTTVHTCAEGELVKSWDARPDVRVTWAVAAEMQVAA